MSMGGHSWVKTRETLLALLVVTLVFLNFGHVSVTASGDIRVTPDSWCGDPLLPDSPEHSPCHACRIGSGAALPPAPLCVEPVAFVALAVVYLAPMPPVDLRLYARPSQPRGPPLFV
jgi:hypothetical protein